jgi:hypothetical protein
MENILEIKTRISKVIFTVEVNERLVGKRFCGRILIGKGRIRFLCGGNYIR